MLSPLRVKYWCRPTFVMMKRSPGGAVTTRTLFRSIDGDAGGEPFYRFFKTERERHLDVRAPLWLWARRLAFHFATPKEVSKDVAKTSPGPTGSGRRAPVETRKIKR